MNIIKEDKVEEEEKIILADLSHDELISLKNKISIEAFKKMSEELLESSNLISLSTFFGIEFSVEDPLETLKSIFKHVKEHIRPLIDLDEEITPITLELDI